MIAKPMIEGREMDGNGANGMSTIEPCLARVYLERRIFLREAILFWRKLLCHPEEPINPGGVFSGDIDAIAMTSVLQPMISFQFRFARFS